jgi:hypothetical protein
VHSVLTDEELAAADNDVERALKNKRAKGQEHLLETGSLPQDWPLGISVFEDRKHAKKFESVDAYMEKAKEYFVEMAATARIPTLSGLTLHMGFSQPSTHNNYVRKNVQYRDAHATLMTMLQLPLEYALALQGVNTKGIEFRLKNIPEGWEATEPPNAPVRYAWKDRRQAEMVGLDGTALGVSTVDRKPEDVYKEMMQQGRRLEEPDESTEPTEE